MMPSLIKFFILFPSAIYLISLLFPSGNEQRISGFTLSALAIQLLSIVTYCIVWILSDFPLIETKEIVLYQSPDFEFYISYRFDKTTAVFAGVGALIIFVVAWFSKYYLHRDAGFRRFFSNLLLFYTGYNFIVFSGNFETLFIGWELIGITSFLLISFYRDRYLPARNSYKVLSFYRLGDLCLIIAMWLSHHLWHKNISFSIWNDSNAVKELFANHSTETFILALLIFVAAAIKSAQFPFFTWLPRAMEGPTSSSAVFYGSLSVHTGLFLLLRTYPLWEHDLLLKGLIIGIGLATTIMASSISFVQSTVKTQIAYASITQIGLMFIEIALGWHLLALLHFTGNAFLRTYQLLVSPSVLHYRLHYMFFKTSPVSGNNAASPLLKLKTSLYLLGVKEWNFDHILKHYLWNPFKKTGNNLNTLIFSPGLLPVVLISTTALWCLKSKLNFTAQQNEAVALVLATVSFIVLLTAFSGRKDARNVWGWVVLSQLFVLLSLIWNNQIELNRLILFISGTVAGAITGLWCLTKLTKKEGNLLLSEYHGHSYEHPKYTVVFLLSCLAITGFPLTPTFIGVDLMFMSIAKHQPILLVLLGLNFLFLELTLLRIYIRVFLGQHKKNYHPVAFKSS